jgi:hypothetical protein
MKPYAIDYETYYSKEYTIKDLGNWAYVNHPEFDAFMLAVSCEEGDWVGRPEEFDWTLLNGNLVIAHNAGFEQAVTTRLIELGKIPYVEFGELVDTADLAAYLGYPRSLAAAAKGLLGVEVDKSTRTNACGQRWEDMTPDFQAKMLRYAGNDSHLELRLWNEFGHLWPEWERLVSRLTREMCIRGLPVNLERIQAGIAILEAALNRTRDRIPWMKGVDPTTPAGKKIKPTSPKQFKAECLKSGIEAPASLAKTSEEFDAWLKEHGATLPWAKAVGEVRTLNMKLKKLVTMKMRSRPDNVLPYALKYCGAHTLRDSGDGGFNPQNLDRLPMFITPEQVVTDDDTIQHLVKLRKEGILPENVQTIDMRGMLEAPEGKIFGVVDLSAIEPCVITTLAGDEEMRQMLMSGLDPYEAQARADGEYDDPMPLKDYDKKNGTQIRQYNKVKVLGCGYGAGPEKVQYIAKTMVGIELSLEQTQALVYKYRQRGFVKSLWERLEADMRKSVGEDYAMHLPSGRSMLYRDVKGFGGLSAVIPRNGVFMRLGFWGGTLAENATQAAARDVFMDRVIAVTNEYYDIRLRVHDEIVTLLDEETAETDLKVICDIMGTSPKWWPELPVRAEGHLCKIYHK